MASVRALGRSLLHPTSSMPSASASKWLPLALIFAGILFHSLYVFSIITIYFQSPLVFGLSPYRGMPQEAPAKRLVLFVGTLQALPLPDVGPLLGSRLASMFIHVVG